MANCPECDVELEVDDHDLEEMEPGDPWDCEACGSHLRVVSTSPLLFESEDDDLEDEDGGEEEDADDDIDDDFEDDEDGDADDGGDWDE